MATPTIPTEEPKAIHAGETLKWRKSLPDYLPSDYWTLVYQFRGPGPGLDAVAAPDGDDHLVTIAAATTAAMAGGLWFWQAYAEKGAERYFVTSGQLNVTAPLPDKDQTYDGRSLIKKILDAIDAAILGKATKDQLKYKIGDRELERYSLADLGELRKNYAALYQQELQAAGLAKGRSKFKTVLTRFTQPE